MYSEEEVVEIPVSDEVEVVEIPVSELKWWRFPDEVEVVEIPPSPEAEKNWKMTSHQGVSKPFIIVIVSYFTFSRGCIL